MVSRNFWQVDTLKFLRILIISFIVLVTTSCSQGLLKDDSAGPSFEAVAWLTSNANPYAFAGNRFDSTEDALAFVEFLYANGALEVFVTGIYDEEWRMEAEGGPYADTLIIRLPLAEEARRILFDIANEEAAWEGFSSVRDSGQEELLLWWD